MKESRIGILFWAKKDYLQDAYPWHRLQCYAYLRATGIPEGRIFYISKDDLTVAEFSLKLDDPELNRRYEEDVTTMTKYIQDKVEPPKPEDIVFDPRKKLRFQHLTKKQVIQGCWVENWEIAWSNYISHITGIKGKTQADVVSAWKKKIAMTLRSKNDELKTKFKANLK